MTTNVHGSCYFQTSGSALVLPCSPQETQVNCAGTLNHSSQSASLHKKPQRVKLGRRWKRNLQRRTLIPRSQCGVYHLTRALLRGENQYFVARKRRRGAEFLTEQAIVSRLPIRLPYTTAHLRNHSCDRQQFEVHSLQIYPISLTRSQSDDFVFANLTLRLEDGMTNCQLLRSPLIKSHKKHYSENLSLSWMSSVYRLILI